MDWTPGSIIRWLFDSEYGLRERLIPRWIFLRALGLIYFSAFFSLVFQIRGLIGAEGILPSNEFLVAVANHFGASALLVCANAAVDLRRPPHAERDLLGGHARVVVAGRSTSGRAACW